MTRKRSVHLEPHWERNRGPSMGDGTGIVHGPGLGSRDGKNRERCTGFRLLPLYRAFFPSPFLFCDTEAVNDPGPGPDGLDPAFLRMNGNHKTRSNVRLMGPAHRSTSGFTLLEVMVALAILAVSLTAVFTINSSSIYGHVYAKKLTVATLLARAKMTDLEQELYDKGFKADDDEQAGDFSDEGWPSFKWRAKIVAPKTQGLTPNQLIGAIFNFPMGGGGKDSKDGKGGGGLTDLFGSMFGGGTAPGGAEGLAENLTGGGAIPGGGGIAGAMGPMAGLMAGPFQQMVDQLTQAVREVHLTVTWKEGRINESFDIITHVVSLGPGSDRNGGAAAAAVAAAGGDANAPSATYVNANTGAPVMTPIPCANGQGMCDGDATTPAIPKEQYRGAAGGPLGGPGPKGLNGGFNGSNNPLLRGGMGLPPGLGGIRRPTQ